MSNFVLFSVTVCQSRFGLSENDTRDGAKFFLFLYGPELIPLQFKTALKIDTTRNVTYFAPIPDL